MSAKTKLSLIGFGVMLALLALPGGASADFGIKSFDTAINADAGGAPFSQAGGHPYSITTRIEWNNHPSEDAATEGAPTPDGDLKDAIVELPPGLIGNPEATLRCTAAQLAPGSDNREGSECPVGSQVGVIHLEFSFTEALKAGSTFPVFNMTAPSGIPARFGFRVIGTPVYLDAHLRNDGDYGIDVGSLDVPEALKPVSSKVTFWGVPADSSHDFQRCNYASFGFDEAEGCGNASHGSAETGAGEFSSDGPRIPFLVMPTACTPPGVGQEWKLRSDSWEESGVFDEASIFTHLPPYAPAEGAPGLEQGPEGCDRVPFTPGLTALPSQRNASSATGLTASVQMSTEGLLNPDGIAQSAIEKAVVALPEGVTINPSQGEGLGVCTAAEYAQEREGKSASEGCPSTAKIGTVTVHTPLLAGALEGEVYIAKPHENPFDSLLAIYAVIRAPDHGVYIKLAGKVDTDPDTGQITTTFDNLPQVPIESFQLKLREGARAPLVTPSSCGAFTTVATLYPWARPEEPVVSTSSFEVTHGVGGGSCPQGGLPPFKPGLLAGSVNNAAGAYSPFYVQLTRNDEEQEITQFSIKLPPGVIGKLAGIPFCPDAAIEAAKHRSGTEELESPACPAASEIGHTLVGAGVGTVQAYVPGRVYLAGPYHGSPLSIAAITAAKVGPFDLGTVVVREALAVNPETAEVFVDATGSDPIPHIIQGITTHVRDIRVYVDRPEFVRNPTSCERTSTASTVLGSGLDFASEADDNPITVSSPFQAADCAALGFKPKLVLSLKGGTRRNQVPAFKAVLTARPGDANIARSEVILPHSEFLEQGHIHTICTRVQFAEGGGHGERCPAGSVYGRARAITPILSEPLEGPVFLRANGGERKVPDLVAALRGQEINVDLVGFIDSVHEKNKHGEVISRIRNRFETVPDAPVTKFMLEMKGGKQGLLVNSTNLCKRAQRAEVSFDAHNGKVRDFKPELKTSCPRKSKAKRHGRAGT